jgi:hypothetical protein
MKSITKRIFFPMALLGAVLFTATPPASAVEEPDDLLPVGLGCPGFNLGITSTGSEPLVREFTDEDGDVVRTISVGNDVVLTYTNYGTDPDAPVAGKSITFKTAGSVTRTVNNPDGTQTVTATGHNGVILFPTDIPAGPTATQYVGRIVYEVDPATGVFTLVSTSGRAVDICAALAE